LTAGPAPVADLESQRFWDALRQHRIVLQRCNSCQQVRFPAMPACPYCGARGHQEVEALGGGRVHALVRVHRALTPAMRDQVPYAVAVVQLDEGARVLARVEEGSGPARIDERVRACFVDHEEWTELRFQPDAGAAPR
jgi:uncharacterized protein